MNYKRWIGATIALFVFMFFYEWFVNGYLMTPLYEKTAKVWRPLAEMQANMLLRFVILFLIAAVIALFYSQFYRPGSWEVGLKFGLFLGIITGLEAAAWYVWLPVTGELSISWFVANAIEGLIGGLILAAIYHNKQQ